jgi:predicted ATP-grasp superfamily ATP-dependent carboligase
MKKTIGRLEKVNFPEFGMKNISAKVDTGAFTGALHTTKIHEKNEEGAAVLHFSPFDHPKKVYKTDNFERGIVKSSNGDISERYFIETSIEVRGKRYAITLTLREKREEEAKTIFSRGVTEDINDLIEELGGTPIIIKLARGTHGNGVVLAETKKAAKSVLQGFYLMDDDGTNVLLQEYIEESAGEDIRALVVGSKVVASMKRQSLDDDFRSNIHQGGTGTVVKLTDEEKRTALKAAKAVGLQICGVDLIRSKRGSLVLEVNSSPGLEGIEKVTGRDVAGKIIDHIERNAKQRRRKDRVGA